MVRIVGAADVMGTARNILAGRPSRRERSLLHGHPY